MKKNISFINMNPPYDLKADTLMLATPFTTEAIQQVLVYDTDVRIRNLTKAVDDEQHETKLELSSTTFDKINEGSHTVVIPDALFSNNSKVFKTEAFVQHGLEPLGKFYRNGGRVIIVCMEGVFNVTDSINKLFGTEWKTKFYESSVVEPTERGRSLFGQFVPDQYCLTDNPYFIQCPAGEGLFQKMMNDKEEFVKNFHAEDATFERLGIEKDESMDCFNVEKSWENYLAKYTDRHSIALHEGKGNEGQVIWFGDRGRSDGVAFIFCKLFNVNLEEKPRLPVEFNYVQDADSSMALAKKRPNTTVLFSIIVVFFAVAARYLGLQ